MKRREGREMALAEGVRAGRITRQVYEGCQPSHHRASSVSPTIRSELAAAHLRGLGVMWQRESRTANFQIFRFERVRSSD